MVKSYGVVVVLVVLVVLVVAHEIILSATAKNT